MIFKRDDDDHCDGHGPSFKQSLVLAVVAALVPSIGQMMVDAMNKYHESKKPSEDSEARWKMLIENERQERKKLKEERKKENKNDKK